MTRTRRRGGKHDVNKTTFKERQLVKTSFWSGEPMSEVICRSLDIDLLEKERIKDVAYEWEYEKFKAAADGDLERLKQVHRVYPPWERIVPEYRDVDDDLDLLCTVAAIAAKEGHLDCLQYAHENGAVIDVFTCLEAAKGGSVECLKYAHENVEGAEFYFGIDGESLDESVRLEAAQHGHLDCLKFIHENGRGSNFHNLDLCLEAMYNGSFECLKYVHENGSPVTWNDCVHLLGRLARESGRGDPHKKVDNLIECLKYVVKHETSVIEWDPGCIVDVFGEPTSVFPWLVDAYVGNMVDDIFCRVIREMEILEKEKAAVVIQRRWLNHIYSPGARSTVMKRLADDFASRVQ